MGKISRVLEKSGYTFGQQNSSVGLEEESTISTTTEDQPHGEEISSNGDSHSLTKLQVSTEVLKETKIATNLKTDRSLSEGLTSGDHNTKRAVFLEGWDDRLKMVANFSDRVSEDFRVLRTKILVPPDGKPARKSIMVTSVLPGEGKSFISASLGIALAHGVDQHSLVVDCDLRFPSLAPLFGISSERGLSEYLNDGTDLSDLIQKTSVDKLSILPSGRPPANPAEMLGSMRMHKLIDELSLRYPDRFVVFDTPPLQVASESIVLSQVVDGVVLVVRDGVSSRPLIEKCIEEIGKDKIIGVIFNGHKSNFITSKFVNKSQYDYGNYYGKPAS